MAEKRRLPVLKSEPAEEDDSKHPPWQWVGFGVVMIFTTWLPLAWVGWRVMRSVDESASLAWTLVRNAVAVLVPVAIATMAGGFLVGRYGKPAGEREALQAGLLVGIIASVLAAASGGAKWEGFLAITIATTLFAWLGGRYGVKRRKG